MEKFKYKKEKPMRNLKKKRCAYVHMCIET